MQNDCGNSNSLGNLDDFLSGSDIEQYGNIEHINLQHFNSSPESFSDSTSNAFQVPSLPMPSVDSSTVVVLPDTQDVVHDFQDENAFLQMLADSNSRPPTFQSLPASNNWLGNHGFNILFDVDYKDNFAYSPEKDKLYVTKDSPFAFNLYTNNTVPSGAQIRVMSVYTQPTDVYYDVHRCFNHALADFRKKIKSSDHLIRCENAPVTYVQNQQTHRRSIIMPYYSPQGGNSYSTYILKFSCLNSCSGGMNRRPIKVVFTLEHENIVIGRRSVEVKVCSNPSRDIEKESGRSKKNEKETKTTTVPNDISTDQTQPLSKKRKLEPNSLISEIVDYAQELANAKPNSGVPFFIYAYSRHQAQYLKTCREMFRFVKTISSLPLDRSSSQNQ